MNKERLVDLFKNQFGYVPQSYNFYSVPGRTEICGNHTDHQGGHVLAGAIDLRMYAFVEKRADNVIHLISEGFPYTVVNTLDDEIRENEFGTMSSLIRGICSTFRLREYEVGGLNISIYSDVLEGSGLSSSAAFEVLIGLILSHEFNNASVSAVELAEIGQLSENIYFGKPSGLMDQLACSIGGIVHIDFSDKKNPLIERIQFNQDEYEICIVDTKGSHADLTPEYSAVPIEMKLIAQYYGKSILSEVDEFEFKKDVSKLRELAGDRAVLRAFHYFNENHRVKEAVAALLREDFKSFLSIIKESGDSSFKYLQNVYPASDPSNQSISIGLAFAQEFSKDSGVSRVHGGGFAGTIQAYVKKADIKNFTSHMESIFEKGCVHVMSISPEGGLLHNETI